MDDTKGWDVGKWKAVRDKREASELRKFIIVNKIENSE